MNVLTPRQKAVAVALAAGLVVFIFELIRRRKLREEYSWLWMLSGLGILVLAVWDALLATLSRWIGAASPPPTLFFFGLLFLFLICLQYAVRISRLTVQMKNLAQKVAILEAERRGDPQSRPPTTSA